MPNQWFRSRVLFLVFTVVNAVASVKTEHFKHHIDCRDNGIAKTIVLLTAVECILRFVHLYVSPKLFSTLLNLSIKLERLHLVLLFFFFFALINSKNKYFLAFCSAQLYKKKKFGKDYLLDTIRIVIKSDAVWRQRRQSAKTFFCCLVFLIHSFFCNLYCIKFCMRMAFKYVPQILLTIIIELLNKVCKRMRTKKKKKAFVGQFSLDRDCYCCLHCRCQKLVKLKSWVLSQFISLVSVYWRKKKGSSNERHWYRYWPVYFWPFH